MNNSCVIQLMINVEPETGCMQVQDVGEQLSVHKVDAGQHMVGRFNGSKPAKILSNGKEFLTQPLKGDRGDIR